MWGLVVLSHDRPLFIKEVTNMVSIKQIESGIASYLDSELMPMLPQSGLEKVILGTGVSLLLKKNINKIDQIRTMPVVKAMGIFDEEGNVDIETLKDEVKNHLPEEGIKYDIPMIGTITFRKGDIDKLYENIVGQG